MPNQPFPILATEALDAWCSSSHFCDPVAAPRGLEYDVLPFPDLAYFG